MSDPPPLPAFPPRDPQGHKGTFGTVAVVGGCALAETRMIGAPTLSATAALRVGAGLARLVMPEPVLNAGLTLAPWTTGRAIPTDSRGEIIPHEAASVIDAVVKMCNCLAIGPGLGRGEGPRAATLRAIQQEDVPVVVDADALNALSEIPELTLDLHAAAVLTPHPGEFKRLCEGLGLKNNLGMDQSRTGAAEQLAQRLGCIVVLKGARTVVSNGQSSWESTYIDSCLAVGGTGDVLTGVIAGLIAQFVAPPPPFALPAGMAAKMPKPDGKPLTLFDAACLGVEVHAVAAQRWRASHANAAAGLLATELIDQLPGAVEQLRSR
ncbi:MAG: NAD(P)H-hydrate dehydratase [Pyrinomonadaceae bacterium]|nr:NAD(P)H-hydrate dehydratase [Phycisphaerales bacterium]